MFKKLDKPRFHIRESIEQEQKIFLSWDFVFSFKGESLVQTIHGGSYLELDPRGKVAVHRDYWDAAEELYEKLPMIGALMRWLKRRANA
jgi:steroid Delta-isomerase